MSYLVIGILIIGGILWAIVSFFEWLGKTTTQVKARISVDTSKTIVERNQDLIQAALAKIYTDSWPHYVENQVRDCIGEIAKREGRPDLAPKYREWLSAWERRSDIPAEYQELKQHLKETLQARYDEKQTEAKQKQNEHEQREKAATEKVGLTLIERNKDLIDKFLEIAERKVSMIDDYGDEKWDTLPDEILACLKKISQRENASIDWQRYAKPRSYYALPDDYQWLKEHLGQLFNEYHATQKNRPARTTSPNGLSGIEFEVWVAKLLKENGYDDVRGTPATGDQGADLIAKKDGRTIIIQAKRYQGTVGNKAVQEVISAVGFYNGDEGWVVTSSTFTPSAKALAHKMNVRLIDGHDLERFGEKAVAVVS
jgi:restriction system protein